MVLILPILWKYASKSVYRTYTWICLLYAIPYCCLNGVERFSTWWFLPPRHHMLVCSRYKWIRHYFDFGFCTIDKLLALPQKSWMSSLCSDLKSWMLLSYYEDGRKIHENCDVPPWELGTIQSGLSVMPSRSQSVDFLRTPVHFESHQDLDVAVLVLYQFLESLGRDVSRVR